jgi:hypothetical protein
MNLVSFGIDRQFPEFIQDSKGRYFAVFGSNASVDEIYWSVSNNGIDWSPAYQLTLNALEDRQPSLTQDANRTYSVVPQVE